ncbi:hypothetical protein RIF29_27404 [Crotalaria pallida]|uniref:Uncharacterized protein n=1 Tax=Crotalaria pallida TaxID=3830 RepID=A0AAN9I101_CROPI
MYGHDSNVCKKQTKKIWVEKKKRTREEVEDLDERLKLKESIVEGLIPEPNLARSIKAVGDLQDQQIEVVVPDKARLSNPTFQELQLVV